MEHRNTKLGARGRRLAASPPSAHNPARRRLYTGVCLACVAYGTAAHAQTKSDSQPGPAPVAAVAASDPAASSTGLSEVIVTAQRRTQNLQKVPISVTALSSVDLQKEQITNSRELSFAVPNMYSSNNVGQGSANTYYIRGLGQGNSFPTFEPQVGTYIDDIYIARSNASNFSLFGVSQLQVLNGPQGTLFGRNSTGGAIVVTLEKPGTQFGGSGSVSYGSFDEVDAQLSLDAPVNDQLLTRTSAYIVHNDGYVDDITTHQTLNYTHNWGVREAVTILPHNLSNVEWNVTADYESDNSANVYNTPSSTGGANGSDRIAYTGFSTAPGALAPYQTGAKSQLGQGALVLTYGGMSNFKVDLGVGTLDFISGIRETQQLLAVDYPDGELGALSPYDQSPVGTFALDEDLHSAQYSQEVKWNSKIGDLVDYTVGAFYMYESNPHNYGAVANIAGVLGVSGLNYFPAVIGDETTTNNATSSAVYGQADIKVTPQLTVTLGGRFTNEYKWLTAYANVPGEGFTTADIQAYGYKTALTANEFTPRFAVQYQIDPDLMVFASATRGFQGGGWNGLAFTAQTFNDFGPETVWSYETGFRSEFPDQHLRFNATAFFEDIHGFQQEGYSTTALAFTTDNVASMQAYGLEGSLTWLPIDHLSLSGNLGLIDSFFYNPVSAVKLQQQQCVTTGANCNNGIVTPTGAIGSPAYTPPVTVSAMASYVFQLEKLDITPNIAINYTGHEWISTANTPVYGEAAGHVLLNAGVEFKPGNMPVTFTVECKNCTMTDYKQFYLFNFDYYNYPGTWDVRLNFKF